MKKLYTFGKYLKRKFGTKVKKLPLSVPGFTCPNIDGTAARGGCVFCENESFSPNFEKEKPLLNLASKTNPLLSKQLRSIEKQYISTAPDLRKYYGAEKFLIYFQSFTNTYAPFETLKALYEKALKFEDVIGLSIGTRTDSITAKTLDYLQKLDETYEIWVEYGVQSSNDRTLERINRGHTFENVKKTVSDTKKRSLKVCAHLIFGLPGETREDMLKSVEDVINLGIDAVKFHPLYVTKNTLLYNDYKKGLFKPITQEEYLSVLVEAVKMLPDDVIIQRMSAGSADLVAPQWCKDKSKQLSAIHKALTHAGIKLQ